MDPYTLAVLDFGTQLLKVVEQAQISFNNAPPAYKEQYYSRLAKLEALADPVLDVIAAILKPPTIRPSVPFPAIQQDPFTPTTIQPPK